MSKKQFNVGEITTLTACPGCKEQKPQKSFTDKKGSLNKECCRCREVSIDHLREFTEARRDVEDREFLRKKTKELDYY